MPNYVIGFKQITAPTNEHTMIATAFPSMGFGNKISLINFSPHTFPLTPCILANLNVEQFPVLPPQKYAEDFHGSPLADFIKPRVLELCYTAHDNAPFRPCAGLRGRPVCLGRGEAAEVLETFPIVKKHESLRRGELGRKGARLTSKLPPSRPMPRGDITER